MTTFGPYLCYRGNLTNTTQYKSDWFDENSSTHHNYDKPCKAMTDYYVNPTIATNADAGKVYEAMA
jgi:hypothetical protein